MTTPRLPENWEELLTDYALDNCGSPEAEVFQRLLESHPELQTEVTQLQQVLALVPYSLPQQNPPPRLRAAILTAAQTETSAQHPPKVVDLAAGRRWKIWRGVSTAIAAILVAALAVDNYRLRQTLQSTPSFESILKQPDTQIYP
jgi:anti-sigma-K factor RskA